MFYVNSLETTLLADQSRLSGRNHSMLTLCRMLLEVFIRARKPVGKFFFSILHVPNVSCWFRTTAARGRSECRSHDVADVIRISDEHEQHTRARTRVRVDDFCATQVLLLLCAHFDICQFHPLFDIETYSLDRAHDDDDAHTQGRRFLAHTIDLKVFCPLLRLVAVPYVHSLSK